MAKSSMKPEFDFLERDLIATFLAGHLEARPDLPYPQSHSDLQSGFRAILTMFDIKRRPIALEYRELYPTRKHLPHCPCHPYIAICICSEAQDG